MFIEAGSSEEVTISFTRTLTVLVVDNSFLAACRKGL